MIIYRDNLRGIQGSFYIAWREKICFNLTPINIKMITIQ